jgi:enoyl-CoA hydratase/carnithine racemase
VPPAEGPAVIVERARDRLVVTLNRPARHNALDTSMRDELVAALRLGAVDDGVRSIELRGNGPSFSSGGDLDEFGTVGNPATAHAVRLSRHPGWSVYRGRGKVWAHLHGACIGAGVEIPAFAGRVTASSDLVVSLPELAMGLIPGAGGTVSISRRIGRQRCGWLALTGAQIDAATAVRWGLVDELIDPS